MWEYEIAAAMTNVYFERGCERSAYAPIVGSGSNSVILHYAANHRRLDSGETVVADVGAECSDYATDVTRTVPAGGKFTARQRELYEIVLGAQKAAIAAIKPGMRLTHRGTCRCIRSPTTTSTPTATICMASLSGSISFTVWGTTSAWMFTILVIRLLH